MRESIGEARQKAGKREAAVLLVLSLVTLFVIFGTWHVNKIKANEAMGKQHKEEIKKKPYSQKTPASHSSHPKTANETKKPKEKTATAANAGAEIQIAKKTTAHISTATQSQKETNNIQEKNETSVKKLKTPKKIKIENKKTKKAAIAPAVHKSETKQKQIDPSERKTVYLTFDDGPSHVSGGILDILNQFQAKATFFMLEPNILRFPEAVKRMDQEGQALGLHGVSHDPKKIYRTKETVVQEMDQDNLALQKITGKKSVLIRTPYGSAPYMKPAYQDAVREHGYQLWDWTIDSKDWSFRSPQYVEYSIVQIKNMEHRKEPVVILLHERKETLESLPKLLEYLMKNRYQFKRIEPAMKPVTFHVS
ncbi:polysaccharide deacetylase family protein [Fictibacillus sp. NRS-1165]|uniref:polysaccharide deacetylase family protein n=1 Tax=Fictibacillus sp. NRS-1165 TaxID=3144463 RepID=UPI003D1D2F20